ncbi:O-succinylhomoserine sulfhydrylase [Microbulbifer thermotolerans]|uniref:O-succinylhomoserine sulfhydrylase n=1 Tax=Microbulbifer thermotolerans TaxID=252514 RepID=UPI0022489E43|nr:O-succinylhomoserine sulfhydrylase [Microbulbifer thermotolerans]MCX2793774.1 O-succinylhomoserine sulfhydrylase [Microbulbifer thermotolerans]MCX2834674.1 O-succinylhomoserine sulfhydrylase [Microbulbifer thermotolerans]WKT61713.1 O-succinylhomoserine sulfhydrylase [Microbulbifer thermotolerans]
MFEDDGYAFDTLAVRAGQVRSGEGEHSEAMFLTSSYVFPSAAEAAARFSGESSGNVYSRYTNPTVRMFEDRMAALEGGEAAVATASGMAAILSLCMALLKSGDSVICSRSVFGTTTALFARYMKKFGVRITFVDLTDMQQWRDALDGDTKLLFMETPSNPLCEVADIRQLADLAHSAGALLAVDNCFCTPALQRPLSLGADIVVHSATKYLDGQGRCVGGVAVGRRELMGELRAFLRTAGPSMSPFNAWVFLKGLETLSLRMQTHSRNALALAWWLDEQEAVEKVNYTGLPKHPGHLLAAEQQSAFGGMLSFSVRGGREAAWKVIDNCKILSCTANLGDAKTTIVHPATTTHGRLSEEERARAGISESLIRVSVGLEDVEDLQRDLLRGLSQL